MHAALTGLTLLAIGLLPMAFGGVGRLAWSLYGVMVGVLLTLSVLHGLFRKPEGVVAPAHRRALGLLCAGFLILAAWFAVQASGWTPAAFHHPIWALAADYHATTGRAGMAPVSLAPVSLGAISVAPERTWEALARWLAYGATFLLVADLARCRDTAWRLVRGLALIGLAYAAYGLIVQFGGFNMILWFDKAAYRDVVTATFVNRNSYATYGGLTALCWTAWLLRELPEAAPSLPVRRRALGHVQALAGPLVLLSAGLAVVLTSVLLTQSRAGIAATAAGLLVLLGAHGLARGRGRVRAALLVPACLLVGLVGSLSADGVLDRLRHQGTDDGLRAAAAVVMIGGIAESPWLGVGRGAFEPAFALYRDATVTAHFDRGHHEILELVFEVGIPASLLLTGMLALLALVHGHGLRTRNRDAEFPALGLGALMLVGGHAIYDFSLQIPGVAVLYMAIAAVAFSQSFGTGPQRRFRMS